jgi:hypothetical protein
VKRAVDLTGVPVADMFAGENLTLRDRIALYVLREVVEDHSRARTSIPTEVGRFDADAVVSRAYRIAEIVIKEKEAAE